MTGLLAPILLAALQAPQLTDQTAGTTARLQAVSVVSPRVVWASGARGTWVRTTDGGTTWAAGVVPGADTLEFRDVHAASADTAWLLSAGSGGRSRIYRTLDGGVSWMLQFTNTIEAAFFDCLSFWDRRRGVAVSDAVDGAFVVIRTDDGGETWTRAPPAALPPAREGEGMFAASGTCLTVRGDRLGWFGTGAGRVARVIRTTDGGVTWSEAPTPIAQNTPTAGITSVVFFNDRNGMVLGGDLAITDTATDNVAVTEDGGRSWALAAGRPAFPGAVYGAAAVYDRGRAVVAVGPRGASWTPDGGATWLPLDGRNYWSVGFAPDGTGWMVGPNGRITRVAFGPER
jgi:photosystem II stability/assembly factor-like uncharacterized protein